MGSEALRRMISNAGALALRTMVIGLALYGGLDLIRDALAQEDAALYLPNLAQASEVQSLESRVDALEHLLVHVSRDGNDLYITGANLHVVNGTGATDGITNGLGNVIIGYNEERADPLDHDERSGSHMLVVGRELNYSRFGGIVAGSGNETAGDFASAIGGKDNVASGSMSAVFGGEANLASGETDVASGGVSNMATGGCSVAVGGQGNWSSGFLSAAVGGDSNEAYEWASSVLGGRWNLAGGAYAVVSGGRDNTAGGDDSSVSGGYGRSVDGQYNWRAGSLFEEQ